MSADRTVRLLRISHFFLGMMFFFGIEQLFMNKYIGDSSTRGYATIAYIVSTLLFDIPGGILADKFGRKRIALIGCIVQAIGLVVMALSNSLPLYLIGCALFGVYVSLVNGATQALLYDSLLVGNTTKLYGKYQGSIYAMFLLGAAFANVASGFVGQYLGLRAAYLLSVIPSMVAFLVLLKLYEPARTRLNTTKWYTHLNEVVREIKAHPRIIVFGLQFMVTAVVFTTIGEFGQIYILSFGVSTILLGLLWALDAVFAAGGRYISHRASRFPKTAILIYTATILSFIFTHSVFGIILFFLVYGCNEATANIAETEMQDETKSSVRATMFSSVSFVGNLVAVPVLFYFTATYVKHGLHTANFFIGITSALVLLVSMVAVLKNPKVVSV